MAVAWVLFHRLGACSPVVGPTPAPVAIFDVARSLGALFGSGDGRVILRAMVGLIGERHYRLPDQGG